MYTGTSIRNVKSILSDGGLIPSKGTSKHRTATKNAVFLTPSIEGALLYADASSPAILEIEAGGLPIIPDVDDTGKKSEWLLSDLQNNTGWYSANWGLPVPDDLYDEVYSYLEEADFDVRGEIDGEGRLQLSPWVAISIDSVECDWEWWFEIYEEASTEDLLFKESEYPGSYYALIPQYMCHCRVPQSRIMRVYLTQKLPISAETLEVRDLKVVLNREDEEGEPYLDYDSPTFYGYKPQDLIRFWKIKPGTLPQDPIWADSRDRGSGIIFRAKSGRILVMRRASGTAQAGTWGIPGGSVPMDYATGEYQSDLESAKRESLEEAGIRVPLGRDPVAGFIWKGTGFTYITYLIDTVSEGDPQPLPQYAWEHDGHLWVGPKEVKRIWASLHPGLRDVLDQNWSTIFPRSQRSASRPIGAEWGDPGKDRKGMKLQSLMFDKRKFPSKRSVQTWVRAFNKRNPKKKLRLPKIEETRKTFRVRQEDPRNFCSSTFRVGRHWESGVQPTYAVPIF